MRDISAFGKFGTPLWVVKRYCRPPKRQCKKSDQYRVIVKDIRPQKKHCQRLCRSRDPGRDDVQTYIWEMNKVQNTEAFSEKWETKVWKNTEPRNIQTHTHKEWWFLEV